MKIAIVQASYSGSTFLVAEQIQQALSQNHQVTLYNPDRLTPELINSHDLVLCGTTSWLDGKQQGQPHFRWKDAITRLKGQSLEGKKFAVFGCGDKDAYPSTFCAAVDRLESFVKINKGTLVQPGLKVDAYYFDIDTNTKHVQDWTKKLGEKLQS